MFLTTLLLVVIVGYRNKAPKLKAMRTGRCACNPWCSENHLECAPNSEVWNSVLILSCLSVLLPVADSHKLQVLRDVQNALTETKALFERSDAHLYTPNIEEITNCTNKFIDCYLLEMNVLLHEENVTDRNKIKIEKTLEKYNKYNCLARHPCEVAELTNSTVFYQRMTTFLEKLTLLCQNKTSVSTCD